MKRIFLAFLAITFLSPATGSVFAMTTMDSDSHSSAMVAVGTAMEDMHAMDANCTHHEKRSPIDLDCCNPEFTHSKVGIWEKSSGEKTVTPFHPARFPDFTDASYATLSRHTVYFSTAPPHGFQNYSRLVGIVKRLD